jgi:hypothetical protein
MEKRFWLDLDNTAFFGFYIDKIFLIFVDPFSKQVGVALLIKLDSIRKGGLL